MDTKSKDPTLLSRKDFFVLTVTLIGTAAVEPNCSSSGDGGGRGGSGGASGPGVGGTSGGGGTSGSGGTSGTAGTTGASGGAGGTGAAGTNGTAGGAGGGGAGTGGAGGGGGSGSSACTIPLPETQVAVAATDSNLHTHTVMVGAATLDATPPQTLVTSSAGVPAHTHMVTLTADNLATLRGGGMVDALSTLAGTHTHTYRISCT
jgi:hypothetical protein